MFLFTWRLMKNQPELSLKLLQKKLTLYNVIFPTLNNKFQSKKIQTNKTKNKKQKQILSLNKVSKHLFS